MNLPWDWGFGLTAFFTQLRATTAKRAALYSMQITTVASVDKVGAWAPSQPRTREGAWRHHVTVKEKQTPEMVMRRRKRGPAFKMQVFVSFSRSAARFRPSILVSCLSVIHEVPLAVHFGPGPHGSWGDSTVQKVNLLLFYLGYQMTPLCMPCLPWVALKNT